MGRQNTDIRLRALKFDLDQLNTAYQDARRDHVIDSGIEYGKKYPYNDENINFFEKSDELKKSRQDILFFTIFNFTQVYYSIKEYLKQEFPNKKDEIENFYSGRKLGFKARKEISNDLKHNPDKDLKHDFRQVSEETRREGNKIISEIMYKETWFYYELDSVDYCNELYRDLFEFINMQLLR